jgi:nucleoside phosphorylase
MIDPRTARTGPIHRGRARPRGILVVSAFAPELGPLRQALKRSRLRASGVVSIPVGIGLVDAALGTARAIIRFRPRMILFVGTAGSYGATPSIGSVAIARRALLASAAVARGDGYLPARMASETVPDGGLRRALRQCAGAEATVADVATPIAITSSGALGRRLSAASHATVENLELFAVARAADTAAVPWGAVLGISNRVGPSAHADWRRHQERATDAACGVVQDFLERHAAKPGISALTAPNRSRRGRPPPVPRPA